MQKPPVALHSATHIQKNNRRIKKMLLIFGTMIAIAVAFIAVSFVWRDATHMNNQNESMSQLATTLITCIIGSVIIFTWGMKMTPFLSYRKYLKESYRGLSREVEGTVKFIAKDYTHRDGLDFIACIINVEDVDHDDDDRLLYWDPRVGVPPFSEKDRVNVKAHGNDIIGYTVAG